MSDNIEIPMGDSFPNELLLRYVAGSATDDERAQVREYVSVHGSAALDSVRAIWAASADPIPPTDADRFVARLRQRMANERSIHPRAAARSGRRYVVWAGVTAAIVAAGLAIVLARTPAPVPPSASRDYATTVGQQATITLRDGSRVTLAPQSRLTVSGGFGDIDRTVTLDGEAHFDVTTHEGAPFIVRARIGQAHVLGTSFDVRQYAEDRLMRVAVVAGKVAVGRTGVGANGVMMALTTIPSGYAAVIGDSAPRVMALSDSGAYTVWKDGHLEFKGAPVTDMLATVGRWYGYQFRLTDSTLALQHVNMSIKLNGDTQLMLKAIKSLLEVTMTFDGPVVTLQRKKGTLSSRVRPLERDALTHLSEIGK